MPQDATFVGAKELFVKKSAIMNFALAHVTYKNSRCISLNTLSTSNTNIFNIVYVALGSNLRFRNSHFIWIVNW
jgi:hypothetical protein